MNNTELEALRRLLFLSQAEAAGLPIQSRSITIAMFIGQRVMAL